MRRSTQRQTSPSNSGPWAGVPPRAALAALLDEYAPLRPAPLCPELFAFQADGLVAVWEAAERLAGHAMPAPFWAYAWAGGSALARVLLDAPELVRGKRVLDLGTGGGVTAIAAARAGAEEVLANDVDPWATAIAELAAERQGLRVTPLLGDLTADPGHDVECDVVLCGDLAYERSATPRLRAWLDRARARGAMVLAADAGRAYFDPSGLELVAAFTIRVPRDLEGIEERTARVYRWP